MKRHSSILAFLLGAFATGLVSEAKATEQTVWGGHYYYGETYQDWSTDYMKLDGSSTSSRKVLQSNGEVICEAYEPNGMKVTDWGYLGGSSDAIVNGRIQTYSNPKWIGRTESAYGWRNDGKTDSSAFIAIAVRFDYIKYNISYDANGGTPKPDSIANQSYDADFNLAAAPVKTGYTFSSWQASSNGGLFGAGSTVNGSALGLADCHVDGSNVTMTAQWTANTYNISCELGNGAWPTVYAPPPSASYDAVFSLPAPTRTGYDFIGWKVTSGLDTTTAKWGTGKNPSSSVSADALCVNGKNEVYFKNLNPSDNAAVTLTAQWRAATIRVTFNNEGGSSGGGILDFLDVTYGNDYPALNVPSQGGNLFRGYVIDGVEYWNEKGQPTKPAWDIPTNCTAHARWEKVDYQLIYDENRSDGSVSKQISRTFEYGVPTVLYDGADFSNLGCTLLGWSTNKQAGKPDDGCEIGGIKSFTESKTLFAVWEKNYFIVYDGNGATNETPMAVQKFVIGVHDQALNLNTYGKVGYTFLGWATNRVAALRLDWKYKDQQILREDLATTLGETNTLYATWKTNTYAVAFNMNGGSDVAPDVLTCAYDNPVNLTWTKKDGGEFTNGAYDFLGWSNDIAKVIYTDRTASVSNLCAIADGTNTLYAVWKLAPLSAAMHCDNLRWESYSYMGRKNKWIPSPDGNGAYQTGAASVEQQWLLAQVPTNGTLSFSWFPNGCVGTKHLSVFISDDKESISTIANLTGDGTKWESYTISDIPAGWYVHIYVSETSDMGLCLVDQMTWTPGGPKPEEKDAVEIKSAAVSDGKFTLSFEFNEDFDYLLKTNADLLIDSWGVMEIEGKKTDNILTFEPQIIEGQPQLFYKVETIQKAD